MRPKLLIPLVLLLAIAVFAAWVWNRLSRQDTDLNAAGMSDVSPEMTANLEGRTLVFATQANVPLKISASDEGYGVLELLGVPESMREHDVTVARQPAREEWNVAVASPDDLSDIDPRFLTSNEGVFLHTTISADGRYIFATRYQGESEDVERIPADGGEMEAVAFSHSKDRWPSCSSDGSRVVFHSFRDENPAGDIYMAVEDDDASDGWRVVRLTDDPDVAYVWPYLSPSANACIAVETNVGQAAGRIAFWRIDDDTLQEKVYFTGEEGLVKYPSLDVDGDLACWQGFDGLEWQIYVKREGEEPVTIDLEPSLDSPCNGFIQPSLSADGTLLLFVEDYRDAGLDRIVIYSIESGDTVYFDGCGGTFLAPSISGRLDADSHE
jgi:hypothetical protein